MISVATVFADYSDARIHDIAQMYIETHASDPEAFNLEHVEAFNQEVPEVIRQRLAEASEVQVRVLSSDELIKALHAGGFEEEVYGPASNLSVSDFVHAFRTYGRDENGRLITALRQYLRTGHLAPQIHTIMDRAGMALREIAKDSPINHHRAMQTGLIQRLEQRELGRTKIEAMMSAPEAGAEPASAAERRAG
jgi:hypothetical protein